MSIGDFFLNGGFLGMLRGYDHRRAGRPYGFEEFEEDIPKVGICLRETMGVINDTVDGLPNPNQTRLLKKEDYDE